MKPKARYKERVELTDIEATIKILLQGELITLPKSKVKKWFSRAFKYLQSTESYERMAKIRDAQTRYTNQLNNKTK